MEFQKKILRIYLNETAMFSPTFVGDYGDYVLPKLNLMDTV